MGLSSTQVPGEEGLSLTGNLMQSSNLEMPKPPAPQRNQQQQQQSERLECPRCGSTNTKFCYYNNYNKSQPRHFCKACKRHWTKGGTLRNVPVGGGRKNKRIKPSNNTGKSITVTPSVSNMPSANSHGKAQVFAQSQQHSRPLAAVPAAQTSITDALFQAIRPLPSLQQNAVNRFSGKILMAEDSYRFTCSTVSPPQNQNMQFSFSSVSAFDNIPCSTSSAYELKLDAYGCTKNQDSSLDSTITTAMPTTSTIFSQPWQDPIISTTGAMEVPNCWNWNDIDPLISADLDATWDDTEIKF